MKSYLKRSLCVSLLIGATYAADIPAANEPSDALIQELASLRDQYEKGVRDNLPKLVKLDKVVNLYLDELRADGYLSFDEKLGIYSFEAPWGHDDAIAFTLTKKGFAKYKTVLKRVIKQRLEKPYQHTCGSHVGKEFNPEENYKVYLDEIGDSATKAMGSFLKFGGVPVNKLRKSFCPRDPSVEGIEVKTVKVTSVLAKGLTKDAKINIFESSSTRLERTFYLMERLLWWWPSIDSAYEENKGSLGVPVLLKGDNGIFAMDKAEIVPGKNGMLAFRDEYCSVLGDFVSSPFFQSKKDLEMALKELLKNMLPLEMGSFAYRELPKKDEESEESKDSFRNFNFVSSAFPIPLLSKLAADKQEVAYDEYMKLPELLLNAPEGTLLHKMVVGNGRLDVPVTVGEKTVNFTVYGNKLSDTFNLLIQYFEALKDVTQRGLGLMVAPLQHELSSNNNYFIFGGIDEETIRRKRYVLDRKIEVSGRTGWREELDSTLPQSVKDANGEDIPFDENVIQAYDFVMYEFGWLGNFFWKGADAFQAFSTAIQKGANPELALRPAPTETQNPVPLSVDPTITSEAKPEPRPVIEESTEE